MYYAPDIFGGEPNPNCTMQIPLSLALYGWIIIGIQAITYSVFLVRYQWKKGRVSNAALKEFVGYNAIRSVITVAVVGLVGNTIWFYWNQTMWKEFDNQYCLESGYSLFYFILWILNLFITFWSALICSIGCCCFICCLPCICKLIRDVQGEQHRV